MLRQDKKSEGQAELNIVIIGSLLTRACEQGRVQKRKCEVSYLAERFLNAVRYAHFTSALKCESR